MQAKVVNPSPLFDTTTIGKLQPGDTFAFSSVPGAVVIRGFKRNDNSGEIQCAWLSDGSVGYYDHNMIVFPVLPVKPIEFALKIKQD